jgi:hypothetical protein
VNLNKLYYKPKINKALNSTEIFTIALGLKDPWEITDIKITDNKGQIKELYLEIGFKRGSKFKDS